MKIVVVNGSIRKGTTYQTLKIIEETMKKHGDYSFEYIHMKDTNLAFCKSCFQCFLKGEETCFQYKESIVYKEMLNSADGIIFSSPVYAMNISGAMKNFIDAITYLFHRPELFHKKGMAVSTTMGSHGKKSAKYLKSVLSAFGVKECVTLGVTQMGKPIDGEKLRSKIEKSALLFHESLHKKEKKPSLKDILWFSMWKASTQIDKQKDYEFWNNHGWYDMPYYYPAKINPIKKLIGHIAYKFLKKVMPIKS